MRSGAVFHRLLFAMFSVPLVCLHGKPGAVFRKIFMLRLMNVLEHNDGHCLPDETGDLYEHVPPDSDSPFLVCFSATLV